MTRPKAQKLAALAAGAVLNSSSREAALLSGVPRRTIRGWKQEQAVDGDMDMSEAVEQVGEAIRPQMIEQAGKILTLAATIVATQLEEMKRTKTEWKPSELRDLTVVSGIWIDKLRLLAADQNAATTPQSPSRDDNPTIIVPHRYGSGKEEAGKSA
jgi:hypothetical protein